MADLVVSGIASAASATNAYCTLAALKAELKITDTDDDSLLYTAINAASRQIDGHCGWRFWQDSAVQARKFHPDNPGTVYLCDDETGDGISTTTGLVVKVDADGDGVFETTLTVDTDYFLEPSNAATRDPAWPYTELHVAPTAAAYFPCGWTRPTVQVTAKFGWPAVPDDVTKACLVQAGQLHKAKDTPFGVAGVSDMGVLRVRSELHPIAKGLLAPYRKPAVG
jgi:hypothetical protein